MNVLFLLFEVRDLGPFLFLCDKYFVALHSENKSIVGETDMNIIHTVTELRSLLRPYRQKGDIIGFVPTMGALHDGHASLVKRCADECDICVVSIFVNPTQFNNKEDLRLYPRSPEKDYALLESVGAAIVFAPTVEEVYPEPDSRIFDFGQLDKVMEGFYRPGHFNGVAQVVSKLFSFVEPHKAFFGEKDFQQLAIIRAMVKQLSLPVEIIGVATVREPSGLALSSRNQRLSDDQRKRATEIYRTLKESVSMISKASLQETAAFVIESINNVPELRVEYFSIVDGDTLQPVDSWEDSNNIVGAIAVYCGEVRLIDHIRYK